jgi:hypothetical protein
VKFQNLDLFLRITEKICHKVYDEKYKCYHNYSITDSAALEWQNVEVMSHRRHVNRYELTVVNFVRICVMSSSEI